MVAFRPQRWLRIFGVIASVTIAARRVTDQVSAGPERLMEMFHVAPSTISIAEPLVFMGVLLACEALAFAGFLAAFLYATKSVEPRGLRLGPMLVLLVQLPLGMVFGVELAYVATAAVPFLLRGRAAWTWLGFEVALLWLVVLPGASPGNVELSPGLSHTAFPLALAISLTEATAWLLFAFCAGYLIVHAEQGRRELAYRNASLEATQAILSQTSALNERLRISRELHDSVGHHLVGLSVNLELASHLAAGKALIPVQRAQLIARVLLAEVREAVSVMREEKSLDLNRALEQLAAGIEDLQVHLDAAPESASLEPPLAHLFFRCAQEAVTNTRKHSGARNLWLSIQPDGDGYRMTARDDGRGCDALVPGNGLRGMRERAEEMGAGFEVSTKRGEGFRINVWTTNAWRASEPAL